MNARILKCVNAYEVLVFWLYYSLYEEKNHGCTCVIHVKSNCSVLNYHLKTIWINDYFYYKVLAWISYIFLLFMFYTFIMFIHEAFLMFWYRCESIFFKEILYDKLLKCEKYVFSSQCKNKFKKRKDNMFIALINREFEHVSNLDHMVKVHL